MALQTSDIPRSSSSHGSSSSDGEEVSNTRRDTQADEGSPALSSIGALPWERQQSNVGVDFFEPNETHGDEIWSIEQRSYDAPWSKPLLLRELDKDEFRLRVALRFQQQLVGYAFNYLVADELHILNIAIDPAAQGRGLGKQLLAETLRRAVERGATYATLEVRVTNRVAQALYASLGFHRVGVRRNYYQNTNEDALVLARRLIRAEFPQVIPPVFEAPERKR